MPLSDPARLRRDMARPRILRLWQALQPLRSVVAFMNSGAHPDDETSEMLAALAFRDGLAISYACANRGEGGQNAVGTEATADLGVLRTAEMEQAADVLGLRLYWLSESPEDSVFDFGFSKSGKETLEKWGANRTLARFVDIVRQERPDILCPTFLDVPGQHGHHRAMTETAHRVMEAAADPGFAGSDLPPWQVSKLYLPAWSGAGQSYDDDLPPPEATLTVEGKGCDAVTGWSWAQIGEFSRQHHRTQGMGRWVAPGAERDWPLHLARAFVDCAGETRITDGLPATLPDLAHAAGAAVLAGPLGLAQRRIEAAIGAFPDGPAVAEHAANALTHIREARAACPEGARDAVLHRLDRKEVQLAHVLRLASGVDVQARTDNDWLHPGESTVLTTELRQGDAEMASATPLLPDGWTHSGGAITAGPDAAPTDAYPAAHDPAAPRAPAILVRTTVLGVSSEGRVPLETRPVLLPARAATLAPQAAILNRAAGQRRLSIRLDAVHPADAAAELDLPEGWTARETDTGFEVEAPEGLKDGRLRIGLSLDGAPAFSTRRFDHPHLPPLARATPAGVDVLALQANLPQARIGYVGGGNDRVGHWLAALGADVRDVTDAELGSKTGLAAFDTLVVGIFAFGARPALAAALPRLHAWAAAGGNLVTLYHRPWDNWDADRTPPKRLEIGQPSLRWRVTDETAEVGCLLPDHPLLTTPNAIGPQDWAGWHKERGLYFAKAWDDAYAPLLEMADPEEAPHRGALLSAEIGKGRHVHCALILHHQMEKLVPGAFRLLANLVTPPAAPE